MNTNASFESKLSSMIPEISNSELSSTNSSQTPKRPPLKEPTDNSSQTPKRPSLEGEATVGYYDMFLGQGNPNQVPPIVTAGFDPVNIFDLSPTELSAIDVLFVQNPDNGSYGSEYLTNLSNIENAVEDGLTLIIHDRFVTEAETILPGGEDFDIRRDFADDANIDVRNPSSDLIEGPGGVITDITLDGGTSSSHGFAVEGTLPEDADLALSRSEPSEIVTFSYEFGAGHAVYSSIPLDFYLEGFGPPDVSENFRDIYAPNVVEYGVELIGPSEDIENGSFETGDFSSWRTIGNNSIETADFGSGPTQGTFQALLTNAASRTDSPVTDSELEDFLDLAPGVLDGLSNGDVTEGSAIKQTFTAEAGDILRFDWNFLTNEATPEDTFNDFAFFSLTPLTLELADTGESFVSSLTPFDQETGFQTESIAISEAGTYTLSFGVVDVEDDIIDSGLLIDNVRIGDDDGGVFYSTDRATDQVFQIDPQTGEATLVGNAGFDTSFSGLSIDDDGPLFASDLFDPSTFEWSLATLDLDTGAADIIGPQFDADIHAIAHQDGTLYGFSIFQGLGTLDPDTGEFTASFGFSTFPVEMRGADVDESTNTLFALGADNALYTIDVDTGSASFVGSTGVDFNFRMGLAYNPQDNQLYALGDDSGSGDNLYQIDKDTGAATLIGNTGLVEADSLEFVVNGGTPPPPDEIEPNDTIPEATSTGLVGEGEFSISTEIGDNPNVFPENDVDLFELELNSGDQLIADIDASDIGSELDPILSVFDSTGFLVAQNDDFESLDSFIDFTAEFSDAYYVGVSSFANFDYDPFVEGSGTGSSSGFYDLFLTVNDDGGIEPNDTIPEATSTDLVGEGEFSISTEIGDNPNVFPENDVDLFELELNSGDQLIADIDASDIGSELDPILSVFDSTGFLVAQNDDFESLDSFIDFTAEFSDTYYVGVSSFANFDYDPFVEGSGTGSSSGFYDLSLTINGFEDNEYDIDVVFIDDSLTPDQQAVFEDAASRWEEIIIGDVPDVVVPGFGFVDDVAIDASAPFIDGPGGILGQAGPTVLREGSFLPARGIMQFDSADLQFLEDSGLFNDVILHEMAHVIGFGTIWQEKDLLTGAGGADPRFVGVGATDEYNDIFGVSESGVPVEADFGPGTALSHWDEDLFDNELMTGFINFGENPLSRITAASMGDLGYEVNVGAADSYTPPVIGDPSLEPVGQILAMNLEQKFVKPGVIGRDSTLNFKTEFI